MGADGPTPDREQAGGQPDQASEEPSSDGPTGPSWILGPWTPISAARHCSASSPTALRRRLGASTRRRTLNITPINGPGRSSTRSDILAPPDREPDQELTVRGAVSRALDDATRQRSGQHSQNG
jgi:hypothetical protein